MKVQMEWKLLSEHPGFDSEGRSKAIHALLWARLLVWPRQWSPDIPRSDKYYTGWKVLRCYHSLGEYLPPTNVRSWRLGIDPMDAQVLEIQATHYMDLPLAPDGWESVVPEEWYKLPIQELKDNRR